MNVITLSEFESTGSLVLDGLACLSVPCVVIKRFLEKLSDHRMRTDFYMKKSRSRMRCTRLCTNYTESNERGWISQVQGLSSSIYQCC